MVQNTYILPTIVLQALRKTRIRAKAATLWRKLRCHANALQRQRQHKAKVIMIILLNTHRRPFLTKPFWSSQPVIKATQAPRKGEEKQFLSRPGMSLNYWASIPNGNKAQAFKTNTEPGIIFISSFPTVLLCYELTIQALSSLSKSSWP